MPTTTREKVQVGMHVGNVLLTLARSLYGTVTQVIVEQVQNALDVAKKGGRIMITLDLGKRRLVTKDNGGGTSTAVLRKSIESVGEAMKRDHTLIGEKNLGKWAALGVIGTNGRYCIISRPRQSDPKHPFFKLDMDRVLVEGMKEVELPITTMEPGFSLSDPTGDWTSVVTATGIEKSALRLLRHKDNILEEVCNSIASAFSTTIEEKKPVIQVTLINEAGGRSQMTVKPRLFPGLKHVIKIQTGKGAVEFEIYFSYNPQKRPEVMVDHQGRYRFSLRNMTEVWEDFSGVFGSGHVQGIIKVDFCTITDDRKSLMMDENFLAFLDALKKFEDEYGKPWLKKLSEEKGNETFEEVCRNVLDAAAPLVDRSLLKELFGAEVSEGHAGADDGKPGQRIRTRKKTKRRDDDVPPLPGREESPPKPDDGRIHVGVSSETGTRRRIIRGEHGLQIMKSEDEGFRVRIGKEGLEKGKIVISHVHPDYVQADYKGALDTYIRLLMLAVLASAYKKDEAERNRFLTDDLDALLLFSPMMVPTTPPKGSGKKK